MRNLSAMVAAFLKIFKSLPPALLILCFLASSALAERHGLLRAQQCPFSCSTQRIPKNVCRDWREGDTCYVEDLRFPPAAPTAPKVIRPPIYPTPYRDWPPYPPGRDNPEYPGDDCSSASGRYLASPRIELLRIKPTGNYFSDRYKVQGTIEGVCIVEAGYFEYGRKRQTIPITTSRQFERRSFEVVIRANERPEIRAYNVNGDSDIVPIYPDSGYRESPDPYSGPPGRRGSSR